jgi:hypothetical protein
VRLVNGQELFQLIDGAGEKYISYGFRQLARTDYRKTGTEFVVTAEVYDMGSPLGAFGQYSMLLSDSRGHPRGRWVSWHESARVLEGSIPCSIEPRRRLGRAG